MLLTFKIPSLVFYCFLVSTRLAGFYVPGQRRLIMINRREWWCNGVWFEVMIVNLYHSVCVKASCEKVFFRL